MDEPKVPGMGADAARQALARAVSAELDEIFRPAPAVAPPPSGRVKAVLRRSGERREGRVARWGGLAAAGLAGLAVGVALVAQKPPAVEPASAPPRAALPRVVAEAPRPAQPPPAAELPAPVFVPVAAADSRPERPRASQPAPRVVKARAERRRTADRCEGLRGDNRARCAYPKVMEADRRLRRAYAQATRAGVERARLVSYRNRWASLRHRADDQPTRVIAAYGDMARDLDRLARQARS